MQFTDLACLAAPTLSPCCPQPISAGDVLLEVPLRLALTDHPEDDESNALVYEVGMQARVPWEAGVGRRCLQPALDASALSVKPHRP